MLSEMLHKGVNKGNQGFRVLFRGLRDLGDLGVQANVGHIAQGHPQQNGDRLPRRFPVGLVGPVVPCRDSIVA